MTYVAGIGASAGGLEAMLTLFAGMQPTGRIRYVVAQHMAKDGHDELVVRLMQRVSTLPVVLASHGVRLATDTVYVIPSSKDGAVQDGALNLCDPAPQSISTPSVNVLLQSIASSSRDKAIGIVLSGTGSDGAAGCRAIRAAGGLTMAQDPEQAKFNGMPQAAIDSRSVDKVLGVQCMGETLASLFPGKPAADWRPACMALPGAMSLPPAPTQGPELPTSDRDHPALKRLLRQVLSATGIDFSSYKEETLLRRLEKRYAGHGLDSLEAYEAFVQRNPAELQALPHMFLVSVSSFFRDRESFAALQQRLGEMLKKRPAGQSQLQVWVPGCASGEEVYTLAIILRELIGENHSAHAVVITGTDLNPQALQVAKEGVYRPAAFKEMADSVRQRYFVQQGTEFAVGPALREWVRFEQRDVLAGPRSTALDLVSCRNLLIYMKTALQDQLIRGFHQALGPQGLLFIGQSESLSLAGNSLFTPIDHYHRLFRRRN
ncbi:MAG: hypothetical protein KAX88_06560 [Rhodoferax sp.]|nr:hypothetical protein [Rhodoferax sp.]